MRLLFGQPPLIDFSIFQLYVYVKQYRYTIAPLLKNYR